ncbi:MAG: glycosyltransferase family 2 protein [Clostridia bacterium]|nr:glycosyltransferase family 2 protein [Clostridia bacterium]
MEQRSARPYFSILVPVYNTEAYLEECVHSVLSQPFRDFELILTDDGSTDGSPAMLDAFAETDRRIRVFHKENRGLLHTRRFEIANAEGSHIVFLDSDDRLAPHALEILHKSFETTGCDGVFFGCLLFCGDRMLEEDRLCSTPRVISDRRELYRTCFLCDSYNSICRKAVRAEVFDGRPYDRYYHIQAGEDLLQTVEILENCASVLLLPDILYQYRVNPASITRVRKFEPYSLEMVLPSLITDFLKEQNVFTDEDFLDLRNYFTKSMLDKIITVCRYSRNAGMRNSCLDTIWNCRYYTENIRGGVFSKEDLGTGLLLLNAFRKRRFALAACLVRIYDLTVIPARKLLRWIRRIVGGYRS